MPCGSLADPVLDIDTHPEPLPSSFDSAITLPKHDPVPTASESILNRGRGYSKTQGNGSERQRSVTSVVSRPHVPIDDGQPQYKSSANALSRAQSVAHSPSHSPARALTRSQSNISVQNPSVSPSPSRRVNGDDGFAARNSSVNCRRDAVSPLPVASLPSLPGLRQESKVTTPSSIVKAASSSISSAPLSQSKSQRLKINRSNADLTSLLRTETSSVGGFALEHLFAAYVSQADRKIELCSAATLRIAPNIENICGDGVDVAFDQLLSAMGHVVRLKPKPLIDKLMTWKHKHDLSKGTAVTSSPTPDPVKRSIDIIRGSPELKGPGVAPIRTSNKIPAYSPEAESAERRSSAATYLLCRALVEILTQTTLESLTHGLVVLLEDIAFDGTVNKITQDEMRKSSMQRAKWEKAVELLSVLSKLDFAGITGRYLRELRICQPVLATKNHSNPEIVSKAHNMLKGMRKLQPIIPVEGEDKIASWIARASDLTSIQDLFVDVHGQDIKIAYCRMIEGMLLRFARSTQEIYDDQKWRRVVASLHDRLAKLAGKPKYWQTAYPAQIALACVSPNDIFNARWQQMVSALPSRLRELKHRATSLKSACRLTWCLLRRGSDISSTLKSIEELAKIVFFGGRKYFLPKEPANAEPLVQLIRIVGSSFPQFCFHKLIYPLMNGEYIMSVDTPVRSPLDPDKAIIAIRAFQAIMSDLEQKNTPEFPLDFKDESDDLGSLAVAPASPPVTAYRYQARTPSFVNGERLSRPVAITALISPHNDNYVQFCELLARIIRVSDNANGGLAVLDEKFASPTTKTPVTDTWKFARDDDKERSGDERYGLYDLLHTSVQALPKFISQKTPINEMTNLLCAGTTHFVKHIAWSSANSLKSIARQGHAQLVVARFSAFIFGYENSHATMSDGGLLGPARIENTLHLYEELLHVWIEELHLNAGIARQYGSPVLSDSSRLDQLHSATSHDYVNRVEAQGLFFLCSPSNRVRSFAVIVLELVTKLDKALGETNTRTHGILTGRSFATMDFNDGTLSVSERARLQKGMRMGKVNNTLIDVCTSGEHSDTTLWSKIFPRLIKAADSLCKIAVTQARVNVCSRLSQLQSAIEGSHEERSRALTTTSTESAPSRVPSRINTSPNEVTIEQWKLYLIFACTTISANRDPVVAPFASEDSSHTRQNSQSSQAGRDNMDTATDLFSKVVPLLYAENAQVRAAAVAGLVSINANSYKPLSDALSSLLLHYSRSHARQASHNRTASSPQRHSPPQLFQTEVVQVYELTTHFLSDSISFRDEKILDHLANFTKDLKLHLHKGEAHHDDIKLRRHFCGLIQSFFAGVNRTNDPVRWMSFQTRRAHFVCLEEWCEQLAPVESSASRLGDGMSVASRTQAHTQVENQKLRIAAWDAMATLCAGPMHTNAVGGGAHQFVVPRILAWIDLLLRSEGDKPQQIGQRALKNLISYNKSYSTLTESTVEKLYGASKSKTKESYLDVLADLFSATEVPVIAPWKLISALLFTLGHSESIIRMKSLRLLRLIEERDGIAPELRNYDIMVSDKTRAVNLRAQYSLVGEIIVRHADFAYHIFSVYSQHFIDQSFDSQRNMINVLLPWMKVMDLQIEPSGHPIPTSYMVLLNMLYITVRCGSALHTELQALWHALITGEFRGNVSSILNFVVTLCLDRKDETFIRVAKQVTVYMASAGDGKGVVAYFLRRIEPKAMVGQDRRMSLQPPPGNAQLPFVAELSQIFPNPAQQTRMSMGQLGLILLVDLVVDNHTLVIDQLPSLLQVVLVLWDHHLDTVQDQAREMLVHLIHVFVISKVDKTVFDSRQPSIEDLVDLIRRHDPKVVWDYRDNADQTCPFELPDAMSYVVKEAISLFSMTVPSIAQAWGLEAITWAVQCPVKHLACRSLQLYRCLLKPMDQKVFSELVTRTANAIADDSPDMQAYAIDLIRTGRTIAQELSLSSTLWPQIFWYICACLDSIHEWEYSEALSILDIMLDRHDLTNVTTVELILDAKPVKWERCFHGIVQLVYKGCTSSESLCKALDMLSRLVKLGPSLVIGDESQLRTVLLAHLPRFLHSFDVATVRAECVASAEVLRDVCDKHGYDKLSRVLADYARGLIHGEDEFLRKIIDSMKTMLSPKSHAATVKFLMGLLLNPIPWMQSQTLHLLGQLLPAMEPIQPDALSEGPNLFSPLLHLLQTDLCPQALRVIDHVLPVSGAIVDQQQPTSRMPLESGSELRKRADSAKDPLGRPTPTGWSVPMPAEHRKQIKASLLDLSKMFELNTMADNASQPTPDIEFYDDESMMDSYFPDDSPAAQTDTALFAETNMGELVSQLDSLDEFFDGVDDGYDSSIKRAPSHLIPANGQLHSRRQRRNSSKAGKPIGIIAPNGHTTMPTILQGAESVPPGPQVMSPSAFATPELSITPRPPARPSISRSVTMPVNDRLESTTPNNYGFHAQSNDSEPFSDDEMSAGRANASTRAATMIDGNGTIRPSPTTSKPKFGLRNSIKRLASSASADKHRRSPTAVSIKAQLLGEPSPQVPKVPDEYLSNPQSSEL